MGTTIRGLAKLAPRTLALMHGPSFAGDGAAALRALADDYDRRTFGRGLAAEKIEAAKADLNGRRNTAFVGLWKPLVKRLGGRFPVERLSGSGVEGRGHGGDLLGAVHAEIGAFRKVLSQQSVGVLVGAALPWALRIAEVDLHARIDLQAGVLGHLGPLIPGQRPAELLGQGDDRARDGVANRLGAMAGERGSVLHTRRAAMPCQAGKMQQHREPRRAFDEGADRRAAQAEDEISLPVSRHGAIG